ncbi:hypothetical protein Pyn_08071 [Prunus yedoensis var. nudiflora]|uniref:Uncharacterized protein n=1 Tax=Prunus yedoensis var. nudiflora TaxID=2094558 RepID=A0A314V0Z7_PRUYE|nr:hypothetical protein Pyn_08071 [Prunus yedoensis var. nudiflora]
MAEKIFNIKLFHMLLFTQHFINNQHFFFINFAARPPTLLEASTTSKRHHGKNNTILAFTIPMILTLVQMRYGQEDLFKTHRIIMMVVLFSVLGYCLAFSFLGLLLLLMKLSVISDEHDQSHAYIYKWCHVTMMLFGSISVASLLWLLLFPHSFLPPCDLSNLVLVAFAGGTAGVGVQTGAGSR